VSGVKIGSQGRPLPGAGHIELGAYDAEHDLILETDRGLVRVPETNEVGVLLAEPRGPIDPTASVKRGVFGPADTWISTEYLFRRDADGDFWLVGRRDSTVRTARGIVFCDPITDALGLIPAVDLAATYDVPMGGHHVAVTAVTLRPGATITAADLTEAVAAMPFGLGPDIVHVVGEMTLSATYRPTVSPLRAAGIPKPGRHAWYFDADANQFRRLTGPARAALSGAQ
jgi:putative long chain acyl-CoA synthase